MAPLSEAQRLETLLDLQRDLALEEDIDKVLWRITLAATHLLDADRATLYLIDRERHEIWSRVLADGGAAGLGVGTIDEIRLPLDGRSLAAEVARTGGGFRIAEPHPDPRLQRRDRDRARRAARAERFRRCHGRSRSAARAARRGGRRAA